MHDSSAMQHAAWPGVWCSELSPCWPKLLLRPLHVCMSACLHVCMSACLAQAAATEVTQWLPEVPFKHLLSTLPDTPTPVKTHAAPCDPMPADACLQTHACRCMPADACRFSTLAPDPMLGPPSLVPSCPVGPSQPSAACAT